MAKTQQEALELRLATEELWARMCGTAAPAALAQSLAQTRLKLAEELRMQKSELAAERDEIKKLAARLAEMYQKLAAQREETQAWTNARRREIEQQAGMLAKREEQLHHERANGAPWRPRGKANASSSSRKSAASCGSRKARAIRPPREIRRRPDRPRLIRSL